MLLAALAPEVARRLRDAELTYCKAGQTAGVFPPGYHHMRTSAIIGSGPEAFAGAAKALVSWQVQRRAGLHVTSSSAMAEPGAVVLVGLRAGPILIAAPCLVVYVVSEPHRCGFACGTLPGHPERGEEAFIIEQRSDGTVMFTITAFSTPAARLAKATGPTGRALQRRYTPASKPAFFIYALDGGRWRHVHSCRVSP